MKSYGPDEIEVSEELFLIHRINMGEKMTSIEGVVSGTVLLPGGRLIIFTEEPVTVYLKSEAVL